MVCDIASDRQIIDGSLVIVRQVWRWRQNFIAFVGFPGQLGRSLICSYTGLVANRGAFGNAMNSTTSKRRTLRLLAGFVEAGNRNYVPSIIVGGSILVSTPQDVFATHRRSAFTTLGRNTLDCALYMATSGSFQLPQCLLHTWPV